MKIRVKMVGDEVSVNTDGLFEPGVTLMVDEGVPQSVIDLAEIKVEIIKPLFEKYHAPYVYDGNWPFDREGIREISIQMQKRITLASKISLNISEIEKMIGKIKHIEIEYNSDEDAMFFGNDPDVIAELDIEASIAEFEQMVSDKIKSEYPGVSVDFSEHGTRILVDGEYGHADAEYIGQQLFHEVWADFKWIVVKQD